jgi:type II secretory pathway component GspD/PulD (secretin)
MKGGFFKRVLRLLFFGVLVLLCPFSFAAAEGQDSRYNFIFESIGLPQFVRMIYSDVLHRNVLLDGDLADDKTRLTLDVTGVNVDGVGQLVAALLLQHGYRQDDVVAGGGIVRFSKIVKADDVDEEFFYQPKFRSVGYLVDVLGAVFDKSKLSAGRPVGLPDQIKPGSPAPASAASRPGASRAVVSERPTTAYAMQSRDVDSFLFRGSPGEVSRLRGLLAQVDRPTPQVNVRATLYEVDKDKGSTDALGLAVSILGGKLGLTIGDRGQGPTVSFHSGTIDAVFSALNSDSRFKVVSSPSVRVESGKQARMVVGSEVPILGAVSLDANGRSLQSVEYRPSGVILELTATVRQEVIDLVINQQLSTFSATTSGVNNSPTFFKREVSSSMGVRSGDVIVIGGLNESRSSGSATRQRWLPWFGSDVVSDSDSELLLFVQLETIPAR